MQAQEERGRVGGSALDADAGTDRAAVAGPSAVCHGLGRRKCCAAQEATRETQQVCRRQWALPARRHGTKRDSCAGGKGGVPHSWEGSTHTEPTVGYGIAIHSWGLWRGVGDGEAALNDDVIIQPVQTVCQSPNDQPTRCFSVDEFEKCTIDPIRTRCVLL